MDGGGTAEREQRTELRSQLMASLNATVASLIATVLEPPIAPNGTATQEQAAAAALEEERLKKMTKEMIEIGPDLLEAKQHMRNRRGARRMSCPF
mgnify:CR=1 FL=1